MPKAWALLQRPHPHRPREPPTPAPRQRRERPTPAPHKRREPPLRPRASGPPRPRATCRRTPTSRRSFQKCRASGPSRPHAGEGLSRPRASWCSAGLAGSSARSYEDGRWMCLKGTLGADPRAFLEGVRPQIRAKHEEEIKALNGINFQLALKVQLRTTHTAVRSTQTLCCATSRRLFCKTVKSRGLQSSFPHD